MKLDKTVKHYNKTALDELMKNERTYITNYGSYQYLVTGSYFIGIDKKHSFIKESENPINIKTIIEKIKVSENEPIITSNILKDSKNTLRVVEIDDERGNMIKCYFDDKLLNILLKMESPIIRYSLSEKFPNLSNLVFLDYNDNIVGYLLPVRYTEE